MVKPNWEATESAYRAGVLSLRDISDKYGVTEGAIRKRAKKSGWVRKANTQVHRNGTQNGMQESEARTSEKPASAGRTQKNTQPKAESLPDTRPVRGVRTDPPTNPLQSGNQQALKRGGYACHLLLKDEVIEDMKALTLEDGLFRLRASNLVATESIGQQLTKLGDAGGNQGRKTLMENISTAEKAVMRNTVRTESTAGTLATVGKIFANMDYCRTITDKVSLETDRLRRGADIDDGNRERDLNGFYSDTQADAESGSAWLPNNVGA